MDDVFLTMSKESAVLGVLPNEAEEEDPKKGDDRLLKRGMLTTLHGWCLCCPGEALESTSVFRRFLDTPGE
jgi:hypothetical protein